ncbi:MAG TPA: type II toxin-antitoxin system VapC family toxin [Bryobacteraceae bacterium]|jgi:predicted nucleic acid-binding protein|nr:type II toxin-antitoxin system VapC family toxin [Bryobacteraceae bacterium]
MAEFVLDASVAISWCFPGDPTEDTAYSRHILSELATRDAIVPEIWAFEIANIIFVSFVKRKRISEKQIHEYLARLKALPIRVEPNNLWANVELESLARKRNLAAYDVAYLDLARRRNVPLATSDENLSEAASAEGIEVLE